RSYAGPVYQEAQGEVHLRGTAYSALGGVPLATFPGMVYDANMKKDSEIGWIAGLAYQIPEIALKASLTYRSEIEHKLTATETLNNLPAPAVVGGIGLTLDPGKTDVTTPQSVNLDLQSGVMADTVAFLNVRWVNWDGFAIRPNEFGQIIDTLGAATGNTALVGGNLVEYNKDQWS